MFSSMTMASSTTKPTAIVRPISDRLSRLNPIRNIAPSVPTSANGTVTLGMIVAHTLRRNRKITITTNPIDSARVNSTSLTDARITWVRSTMVLTCTDGGMDASSAGRAALMRSTVCITLAPGCLNASRRIPCLPFCQAASSRFCGPRTAWPMSPMCTGAPLRQATTMSLYGAGSVSWSSSSTV